MGHPAMGPTGRNRASMASVESFISWAYKLAKRHYSGSILGAVKCLGLIAEVARLKGSWHSKFGRDWAALTVIHSLELSIVSVVVCNS